MRPNIDKLRRMIDEMNTDRWMVAPHTSVLGTGIVASPSGNVIALGVTSENNAEFMAEAHNKLKDIFNYIDELESAKSGQD